MQLSLHSGYGLSNWQYLSQALGLELVLGKIKREKSVEKKKIMRYGKKDMEVGITLEGMYLCVESLN